MVGLTIGYCAVLGLMVGSFLNVVIYRVPQSQSVVSPGSACPSCGTSITPRDNIPLVSWLILRGKCRHCGASIAVRYPLVELGCAALFAGVAARVHGQWDLPAYLITFAGLFALACIDLEHLLLPKRVVYPTSILAGAGFVLAAGVDGSWHRFGIAAACAAVWFAVFFGLNFASPRLLGFGDVRLAPLLGMSLGWLGIRYALLGFFASNLIGAVVGLALIGSKRMDRSQQVPYGVFLALGTAVTFFAGPELLHPFANLH